MLGRLPLVLLSLGLLAACDCGSSPTTDCRTRADCAASEVCIDGMCVPEVRPDAPGVDAPGTDTAMDEDACARVCGALCCADGETCRDGRCVDDLGPCATSDDCSDDSRCVDGRCVPFDDGESDDECNRVIVAGLFQPTVQCEFSEAPAGDAFPTHLHVLSTPMVADLRVGVAPDAPPAPSIVAVFDDGGDGSSELPTGVIRILDGRTCAQQAELGSLQLTSHSSPPAIGDLDGDGRPEIVAFKAGGGLVAFTYDDVAGAWTVMWRSMSGGAPHDPTGSGWAGPSIADLDGDGAPEVMRSGFVYDNTGELLDAAQGNLPGGSTVGVFPVVADADGDGRVEHVQGDRVLEWDPDANQWALSFNTGQPAGHTALADFGDFPGAMAWPPTTPEVVVMTSGAVRVQTLDGTVVFGPVGIPGGGAGGPPTIADFDGDGQPEMSSAGATFYAVFDMDCTATPIGTCPSGRTDGILWAQRSQDASSNRTGSSVFDFEGDGRAEVVYGDECFLRVYDGASGDVVFSQFRSSCTWYENPVIADVDGDFNAEIVIGNNFNCGSASAGVACTHVEGAGLDPLHAGLRCGEDTDCVSGSCVEGFCRCSDTPQCCPGGDCTASGFVCAAPPAGTPGAGNTCRASHPRGALGIRVYSDAADRWVGSRTIWNQHAYHVTNVDEDGAIPITADINWTTPGLNNFRANVQGSGRPDDAPDSTARTTPVRCGGDGSATLEAQTCNRGTEPIGAGMSVGFYATEVSDANLICRATTAGVLMPGDCELVSCVWADPPTERPGVDVIVVADDLAENGECFEGNNRATMPGVFCGLIE